MNEAKRWVGLKEGGKYNWHVSSQIPETLKTNFSHSHDLI